MNLNFRVICVLSSVYFCGSCNTTDEQTVCTHYRPAHRWDIGLVGFGLLVGYVRVSVWVFVFVQLCLLGAIFSIFTFFAFCFPYFYRYLHVGMIVDVPCARLCVWYDPPVWCEGGENGDGLILTCVRTCVSGPSHSSRCTCLSCLLFHSDAFQFLPLHPSSTPLQRQFRCVIFNPVIIDVWSETKLKFVKPCVSFRFFVRFHLSLLNKCFPVLLFFPFRFRFR